jgi:hyperosmotically inducible periplasmic protein
MLSSKFLGRSLLFAAFALVSCLAISRAQDPQPPDTAPKSTVKDKIDSAVDSVKKGAQSAADSAKEQYHRARGSVHNLTEHGRIYSRFHWDKHLQGAKIEISVKGKVATLTGTVPTAKAKAKAIELAEDTVGIDEVVHHLTITSPTSEAEKP